MTYVSLTWDNTRIDVRVKNWKTFIRSDTVNRGALDGSGRKGTHIEQ